MNEKVDPVPSEYGNITPYLIVDDGNKAIDYYAKVFGATERMRIGGPDGKVGHAELQIGESVIMLAEAFPEMGFKSPKDYGGSPVSICLYVTDVDAVFKGAIDSGAEQIKPLQDQFYGDRSGTIQDPFGHVWTVASRIETLSPSEIQERAAQAFGGGAPD